MNIEQAIATLSASTGKWVTNQTPQDSPYITFEFDGDKFLLAQRILSGASFGVSLEESVQFLEKREVFLAGRTDEYGDQTMPWCSSGWITDEQGLALWYETTSGTVLCQWFSNADNEIIHQVCLPSGRKGGHHHKQLTLIQAGMTSEQYDRWYNCHCLSDKEQEYEEYSVFYNRVLVPAGWEPIQTGRQHKLSIQINKCLRNVHGKWSEEYGIGEQIKHILGWTGDSRPGNIAFCERNRVRNAKQVLEELEKATESFRLLVAKWETEELSPEALALDYEEDYDDLSPVEF